MSNNEKKNPERSSRQGSRIMAILRVWIPRCLDWLKDWPISRRSLEESVILLADIRYRNSGDFNGLPLSSIQNTLECSWEDLKSAIIALIEDGIGAVIWPEVAVNPHILALGFRPAHEQIDYIHGLEDCAASTCLYPTPTYLKESVDREQYNDRPYSLELALGEPQLAFRTFDLHVLESYRNDPRYRYTCSDISGSLSVSDDYYESGEMCSSDEVLLQSFGFAYDDKLYRVVAVFLRYLLDLSPEHQQIWKAREVSGDFTLHPDYYRSSLLGKFPERGSIFEAYCMELRIINAMCNAMSRQPLFRTDFGEHGESRPAKFAFLLRPTLDEYNSFVHLLDKVLSDNISPKFFANNVDLQEEIRRAGGRIEVRPKGTIRLLDEWVRETVELDDWGLWNEAVTNMKAVRQARQKPAHSVEEDSFDYELIPKQRELMKCAYSAVRTIRMLFENHPAVAADKDIDIPDWLREGRIWTL